MMRGQSLLPCLGPLDRRTWLKVGGLSLGALCAGASPHLAQVLAANDRSERDFSVILFWANGGPSHLDTFDLKPDAAEEIRGPFRPIRTNVPGIDICEHLPRLAGIADKFTILRSLHHERGGHSAGAHRVLTGYGPVAASPRSAEYPEIGSVVAWHLKHAHLTAEAQTPSGGVPRFVADTQFYGGGPAFLGRAYAPFMVNPNNPISASGNNTYDDIPIYPPQNGQAVQLAADSTLRLRQRADLLDQLDGFRRAVDRSGALDTWDRHYRQAVEILSSSKTREAFDLDQEPDLVRRRYGDNHWGKSLLTCRRLVEAGVRFVQCQATYRLPAAVARTTTWDDHSVNADIFATYRLKLPVLDHAVSALIEDLHARGLDQRVLFVFCGEFGRSPRIEYDNAERRPGRDHWPRAMSVFLAGGGLRMGQVIGGTNSRAEYPINRPLDSNCLLATIYDRFGIDPAHTVPDATGRPVHILPKGEVIRELVG